MDDLVVNVYRALTRTFPGHVTYCNCCQLRAEHVGDEKIRHLKDCALGKLWEAQGGGLEWANR